VTGVVAAVALAGLLLEAVAAAGAAALGTAGRSRLRSAAEHDGRAPRALRLLEDPARLWATLVVAHGVGLFAAAAAVVSLVEAAPLPASWRAPALVAAALVVTVVAEVVPRAWSARDPEGAALALAPALSAIAAVLAPVSLAVTPIARAIAGRPAVGSGTEIDEDNLRALAGVLDDGEGPLEEEEREMIAGIFELGLTRVREVMVPRIDIVAIPADATLDEALDAIISAGHSRIPVFRDSLDNIAGLLYAKDLLGAFRARDFEPDLSATLRQAYFVPESKPVDALLEEMQGRKVHMAIVVDEYGGTAGLVTIEDLIEEIVGEIQDEYDVEEPRYERVSEAEGTFHAGMDIDDVNRMMDIRLPTDDVDTLAGLVFTRLGKVPDVGERAVFDDAEIEVLALAGRRIRRVRIVRRPAASGPFEPRADRSNADGVP